MTVHTLISETSGSCQHCFRGILFSLARVIPWAERALPLPGHHQQQQRHIGHAVSHHLLHIPGPTPAGGSRGGRGKVLPVHDAADR